MDILYEDKEHNIHTAKEVGMLSDTELEELDIRPIPPYDDLTLGTIISNS